MSIIPSVSSEKYAIPFDNTPGSNKETVDIVVTKYADSTAYYSIVFYKIVENKKFCKKHFTFNQIEFVRFLQTANSVYTLTRLKESSVDEPKEPTESIKTEVD